MGTLVRLGGEGNPVCCDACRDAKVARWNFSELLGKPHVGKQMLQFFNRGVDCWSRGFHGAAVMAFRSCLEAMIKGLFGVGDNRVSLLDALKIGEEAGLVNRSLREDVLSIEDFKGRPATYENAWEALRICSLHMNEAVAPSFGMRAMIGMGGDVGDHITWLTMPRCSVCGTR